MIIILPSFIMTPSMSAATTLEARKDTDKSATDAAVKVLNLVTEHSFAFPRVESSASHLVPWSQRER
jgi:hypothetical protein